MTTQRKGALSATGDRILPVGGITATLTAAPTVSTDAYASGDNVGGKITLSGATRVAGGSGIIQAVTITSKSLQTAPFDVIFFSADPSASTFTDNAAQDLADADLAKVVGVARCAEVVGLSVASIHQALGVALPFALAAGSSLYAAIVVRGTPTLGSTSDIGLAVHIVQD